MTTFIAFLATIVLSVLCLFFLLLYLFKFTSQGFIDFLHLNKFFKKVSAKDMAWSQVLEKVCDIAWNCKGNLKKRLDIRNDWVIAEIDNPINARGYISVIIYRDNRPYEKVCPIMVTTDIAGLDIRTSCVAENMKDFENMLALSGYSIKETFKILRDIQSGDDSAKKAVIDNYVSYGLRQIL